MSNKSKLNVNLFSEYPHGLADKNNTIIEGLLNRQTKKQKSNMDYRITLQIKQLLNLAVVQD